MIPAAFCFDSTVEFYFYFEGFMVADYSVSKPGTLSIVHTGRGRRSWLGPGFSFLCVLGAAGPCICAQNACLVALWCFAAQAAFGVDMC